MAEFAYNNSINSSTNQTPFFACYGFHPRFSIGQQTDESVPHADKQADQLKARMEELQALVNLANKKIKHYYDLKHRAPDDIKVGDKVWLDAQNIKTERPVAKLSAKRIGPYKVLKREGTHAFRLELPHTLRVHPVFHTSLISLKTEDPFGRDPPQPPAEVTPDSEEEYEVEKILDSCKQRNQIQYLVHWKGYGPKSNTWEPIEHLNTAMGAVRKFHRDNPRALRHPDLEEGFTYHVTHGTFWNIYPDESRLSEDIGRTPDTTEPIATQIETAQTTGPEHFWNARASISPGRIISVRRRVPIDPTAGIEDQTDPVPPYAPNPLELPTGRYGPTNIPREERHLYSAHPLTGVRTRSQASNAIKAPIPQRPIQVTEQIEAPAQIRIEERPANPTPPRPHSSSPAPGEVPPEGNKDEYERLLNGPIEDIRRAAARDPALGFFIRMLDDIKDQLLEGITAQIQVQENQQDTGVQTLNTTLQQMTNSISKMEASTGNIKQQVESAAQNAWTAASSSQLGVNEQIKTQNAIDKLSQQMDTIVVAMGAMGKQVSASLNKQEEAIKKLKADTETLQETLQVVEERVSNIDIMDQDHQWEPEAESSRAQAPKRPQGLFPGDNPPGPPSGPPSRGNTPPPRTPKPPRKKGSTKDKIPKGARAKKPEAFNGKRGQEAEIFLMKMEIYFNDYGTAFDNNWKMATFLTNMGEGEAAKWAKPLLRNILDKEPHEYLANWKALKNAFLLAFSDPMQKERAIQNIHKLQQTGSAQHYVTTFRTLMQELDWNKHAFIDVFKKGLKNNVQQELLKATIT
ncbi:Retrotransposon-derived protein PEG10 [Ceratobasidium sp. AG-Ba]|nr:Retrotransposon-derived protein PEG10 [Ceratobasidium sp. AG-Ba]